MSATGSSSPAPSAVPHPAGLPPAPGWPVHPAMVSTTSEIPGYRAKRPLGVVRGLVVRSPNFGGAIASAFEQIAGGVNMQQLVALCDRSRGDSFLLMLQQAAQLGANAVVGVRYASEEVQSGLVEVVAYGTAVWAEPAE